MLHLRSIAFTISVPRWAAVLASACPVGAMAAGLDMERDIRPLLQEYCVKCHSTDKPKGDLDLEPLLAESAWRKHPKVWQNVLEQVKSREMPPKDKPQLNDTQRTQLLGWVEESLLALALEHAGDPGPVVLRRLSNAEYTYTLRDLTQVPSLDPAQEFPVDGAAGEGFSNTGQALVMSPTLLTKYLGAAKAVAAHAVLVPDGIRFSNSVSRRDWTEEIMADIRAFYANFTEAGGVETVTQQGIPLDKNKGGGLPLARYLTASLLVRDSAKSIATAAGEAGLNANYLASLLTFLRDEKESPVWNGLRQRWKSAQAGQIPALVAEIEAWQKALWKFSSVGHIGKVDGPKAWMEPVTPLVARQEMKLKLEPPATGNELTFYLSASDAGDGATGDFVVWHQPKLTRPGRPPVFLRDVKKYVAQQESRRKQFYAATVPALTAAAALSGNDPVDVKLLAQRHGVDPVALQRWFDLLGIGPGGTITLDHLRNQVPKSGDYDFVKGWRTNDLPEVMSNASDQLVKLPGDFKPHGVMVHPSPTLAVAIGWQSPVQATLRVEATVVDAHLACGNGVAWALELRHGNHRQRLAEGITEGGKPSHIGPLENIAVQPGDLLSIIIDPRNGEHTCDLTDLEFTLSTGGAKPQAWSLTREVANDILAGNPHADQAGHEGVWHFYTQPVSGTSAGPMIPPGSLLARWQAAPIAEKPALAAALQQLITSAAPPANSPDAALYAQLTAYTNISSLDESPASPEDGSTSPWGVDPASFGKRPDGSSLEAESLCVQAPNLITVRLPADLFAGAEFTTAGALDTLTGAEGSVQLQLATTKPDPKASLQPTATSQSGASGAWTDSNAAVAFATPVLVNDDSAMRKNFTAAFNGFRAQFPAALCYTKIVPVDEVVTLTLFHREDEPLQRLMLNAEQKAKLDRMWDQLRFVSQDALTLVDAFEQIWQYSTQDGPNAPNGDKRLEPLGVTIKQHAEEFRQRLIETEPRHVAAVLEFAERAYRRSLKDTERTELEKLYRGLREKELPHEEAIRLLLARVLVAPAFLYRSETPAPGAAQTALNDEQLATRLSYFLWSSQPDAELRALAASGKLHEAATLTAQTNRLLADGKVRRLAVEFACSWLQVHGFDSLDEKSERHFPTFRPLREAMYEETILFFTDFFQHQRSVLQVLDADYTFLNESLAQHYGIPGVSGPEWRRVDGLKALGRGGVLGQATTLAKQSGASRTSPILRGNWVSEALLGDRLPRPPKDVPRLPEEETTDTLTVRQLTEKHSSDARCAHCHVKIDAFGFSLEGFDAIGRSRTQDLAQRPIDTKAKVQDGTEIQGLEGLRQYLLTSRREAFLRQFTRKLLGYALGRSVQLSDEPLLSEIRAKLAATDFKIDTAIQLIVHSRQFQDIRGADSKLED